MRYSITVFHFGPEWKRAVAALHMADKKIPDDVNESLREVAYRAAAGAKAKALTIPAHGPKHRGTRRRLSRGVGVRRSPGGYRVTTSMPPGEEALPRGFETQWHHPVFGGMPHVVQHSHYPWFSGPMADQKDYAFRRVIRDLHNAAEFVDRMV